MLVGRKNTSVTWTVPSNNKTVEPYGEPHWSSSLGDAPILDFRIQMANSQDFKTTKAHWLVYTRFQYYATEPKIATLTCQFYVTRSRSSKSSKFLILSFNININAHALFVL